MGEHVESGNLDNKIRNSITVPKITPSFLINKYSISIFNKLYYLKGKNLKKRKIHFFDYFYPLDKINYWNRLYGKDGFIQYQFVIPNENVVQNLRLILKKIYELRLNSFLTVLKKFGKQNNNLLSFPMSGYTLVFDFKVNKTLFKNLNELDKIVIDMGGRIYLTKDSCMSEKMFKHTYKKWEKFQEIREKYHAIGKFCSDQSKRLGLG